MLRRLWSQQCGQAAFDGCESPNASTTWRAPQCVSPDVGGYPAPVNIFLLAAALIGAVGVWCWPPIGWLSLALVVGPVGLSVDWDQFILEVDVPPAAGGRFIREWL